MCADMPSVGVCFFFFNDTATTEISPLSLHDALPISTSTMSCTVRTALNASGCRLRPSSGLRSEEHTSELQSHDHLVCRLLPVNKNARSSEYNAIRHALATTILTCVHVT